MNLLQNELQTQAHIYMHILFKIFIYWNRVLLLFVCIIFHLKRGIFYLKYNFNLNHHKHNLKIIIWLQSTSSLLWLPSKQPVSKLFVRELSFTLNYIRFERERRWKLKQFGTFRLLFIKSFCFVVLAFPNFLLGLTLNHVKWIFNIKDKNKKLKLFQSNDLNFYLFNCCLRWDLFSSHLKQFYFHFNYF